MASGVGSGFPIDVPCFALYLQSVGERTNSRSVVLEAINAASWVQRLAGMDQVSQNPVIKAISDGFQRMLVHPKKRKEPVTPEMLQRVVASMGFPPHWLMLDWQVYVYWHTPLSYV